MKKILLFIIMAVLCFAVNSYAVGDSIPQVDSLNAVSNAQNLIDSVTDTGCTIYCSGINSDDGSIVVDGKRYTLDAIPQNWYDQQWFNIALVAVAALALLIALFLLFFVRTSCTDKDDVIDIIRDYNANHHHHSNEETHHVSSNTDNALKNRIERQNGRIEELEHQLQSLQYQLSQLKNRSSSQNTKPVNTPVVASQPRPVNRPQPDIPVKKKYAAQDATNSNILMNVSDEFDKYSHTFVITMDRGSETEGQFEIINDEEIITNCLNNTDSMLCCVKNGTGSKITRQVPGRVSINGDTAEVKSQAQIFVS